MRRDLLLLAEMIDAAQQAQHLVDGVTVEELEADRQRRDALLWNFTVLGDPLPRSRASTCRPPRSATPTRRPAYPQTVEPSG